MLFHIVPFQSCLLQFIAGFFFLSCSQPFIRFHKLSVYVVGWWCFCLSPGDRSVWETIANVATSIPFVVIGINTPRYDYHPLAAFLIFNPFCPNPLLVLYHNHLCLITASGGAHKVPVWPKIAWVFATLCRQRLATRMYSNSIIGVGVASTLYHTSRGESRRFFRFCDYSMIATTTMVRVPPILFIPAEKMKKPSATNITRKPSFIPCTALLKTWRFFGSLAIWKK